MARLTRFPLRFTLFVKKDACNDEVHGEREMYKLDYSKKIELQEGSEIKCTITSPQDIKLLLLETQD